MRIASLPVTTEHRLDTPHDETGLDDPLPAGRGHAARNRREHALRDKPAFRGLLVDVVVAADRENRMCEAHRLSWRDVDDGDVGLTRRVAATRLDHVVEHE